MAKIGEMVRVIIREPDGNRRQRGKLRTVQRIDDTQKGGYGYLGEWLRPGEQMLAVGTVLLHQDGRNPDRRRLGIIAPDGEWVEHPDYHPRNRDLTCRDKARRWLADPAAVLKEMAAERAERALAAEGDPTYVAHTRAEARQALDWLAELAEEAEEGEPEEAVVTLNRSDAERMLDTLMSVLRWDREDLRTTFEHEFLRGARVLRAALRRADGDMTATYHTISLGE